MKTWIQRMLMALVGTLLFAGPSQAGVLINGSFEDGNWEGANDAWKRLYAGDTSLTGWSVSGFGVDWHNNVHLAPIPFGNRIVELNLDSAQESGVLSQDFATMIGATYQVSFLASAGGDFLGSRQLNVNVGGQNHIYTVVDSANLNLAWRKIEFNFIASQSTSTIAFSNPNMSGGFWGVGLDNVAIELANTVPEPQTYALMLAGLGLIAGIARRRSK